MMKTCLEQNSFVFMEDQ